MKTTVTRVVKWRAGLAAASAGLLVGACFGGRMPPRELYRLSPAQVPAIEQSVLAGSGTVAVAPYATPGIYGDASIVYRLNETEYGEYPTREWAMPLSTMLGLLTQDVLRARRITTGQVVYDPPLRRSQAFIWEGTVREFEEVDRAPDVLAAVRIDARLIRTSDNVVVWMGSERAERTVPAGSSMPAIVRMLSDLAAEVVARLGSQAAPSLGGSAVSAGRQPR